MSLAHKTVFLMARRLNFIGNDYILYYTIICAFDARGMVNIIILYRYILYTVYTPRSYLNTVYVTVFIKNNYYCFMCVCV